MNDEHSTQGGPVEGEANRRSVTRQGAAERARWLAKYAASGMSRRAFSEAHGLNLNTFHGWFTKARRPMAVTPRFAEVVMPAAPPPAIEVVYPNGVRVGLHPQGRADELPAFVRRLAGYPERGPC